MTAPKEFWVSSGHHMTRRTPGGGLAITDELLLAYLARPELVPPDEACDAERRLHASLLADPRRPVATADVETLADADARENWSFMLGFRDHLLAHGSVEGAYRAWFRPGAKSPPPLFLDQMVQLILRNALDGCDDPYVLRAGELFFRPQKASYRSESLMLADLELIEGIEGEQRALMHSAPLTAMMGGGAVDSLDVMTDDTASTYWSRSDAFTMVMNLGGDARARDALARVIETWIAHLLALRVEVEPVARIDDQDWRWFVGLDAEATRIGNALWRGEGPAEDSRVIALYTLRIEEKNRVVPNMAGFPVYLILAVDAAMTVRLKPQNLLTGMPLVVAPAA